MRHLVVAVVVLAGVGVGGARCAQAELISGIERRNSANTAPVIAETALGENATSFVDRAYEYVSVPAEIAGAQYVKMANSDKLVGDFEIDVTLIGNAVLLLFIDNRVGNDGLTQHPADYAGITPDLSSEMAWAADMGFEDMGVDIGVDESGNGVANYWSSVYWKAVSAGTITLLELNESNRNMYGVAAVAVSRSGKVIYVDDDCVVVSADGSSWESAYGTLQNALALADAGDEIRVAQGVYRPDREQNCGRTGCGGEPTASGDREATFQLKNGVAIKGGYAGLGQANPNARDIELYETILSGDLNGDDGPDFANNGENSYSVVKGSYTNSSAAIDGFTIVGGNADDSNGLDDADPGSNGAGMFNYSGGPTVSNCTFRSNSARRSGAGMHNYYSGPTVANCTFTANRVTGGGGGAAANRDADGFSFENCLFSGNMATGAGGGMEVGNSRNGAVTNCTFAGNRALVDGVGMFVWADSDATVTNCIFRDGLDEIADDGSSTITVTYSDVPDTWAGEGNFDADPCFAEDGHWDDNGTPEDVNDDLWVDGDYHLKSQAGRWDPDGQAWVKDAVTSLCIDAGDPESDWTAELWPHGKRINVGAYGGLAEASMSLLDVGARANMDDRDCVDFNDFLLLGERWCVEAPLLAEDLDRNGKVDSKDYAVFAADWRVGLRPDPMVWAAVPYATSSSTIAMAAATAMSCDGGDVEYYFEDHNEPAHNSGWLSLAPGEEPAWEDSDLSSIYTYCYRVKARNKTALFETGWSDVSCAKPFSTDWPLVFQADFEDSRLDSWEATDPSAWRIEDGHGGKVLSLFKNSSYSPPFRSPYNVNLVRDVAVDNFVLELEVLSTNSDYNHRDMCLFFGYQDESHFYYVHLGKTADATANSVFIVDNADRISIADYRTDGIPWDYNWHTVRVLRDVDTGGIEVYFDNMSVPVMTAVSHRFLWGRVGVGSFDDKGQFDDIELRGRSWTEGDLTGPNMPRFFLRR